MLFPMQVLLPIHYDSIVLHGMLYGIYRIISPATHHFMPLTDGYFSHTLGVCGKLGGWGDWEIREVGKKGENQEIKESNQHLDKEAAGRQLEEIGML